MLKSFIRVFVPLLSFLAAFILMSMVLPRSLQGDPLVANLTVALIAALVAVLVFKKLGRNPRFANSPGFYPANLSATKGEIAGDSGGNKKVRGVALAVMVFVAIICSIFFASYLSKESANTKILVRMVTSSAQKIIGNKYTITNVSFPNGTHDYEYIASVLFTRNSDNEENLFTIMVTGDCDTGCRMRLDPQDAARFALGKF